MANSRHYSIGMLSLVIQDRKLHGRVRQWKYNDMVTCVNAVINAVTQGGIIQGVHSVSIRAQKGTQPYEGGGWASEWNRPRRALDFPNMPAIPALQPADMPVVAGGGGAGGGGAGGGGGGGGGGGSSRRVSRRNRRNGDSGGSHRGDRSGRRKHDLAIPEDVDIVGGPGTNFEKPSISSLESEYTPKKRRKLGGLYGPRPVSQPSYRYDLRSRKGT